MLWWRRNRSLLNVRHDPDRCMANFLPLHAAWIIWCHLVLFSYWREGWPCIKRRSKQVLQAEPIVFCTCETQGDWLSLYPLLVASCQLPVLSTSLLRLLCASTTVFHIPSSISLSTPLDLDEERFKTEKGRRKKTLITKPCKTHSNHTTQPNRKHSRHMAEKSTGIYSTERSSIFKIDSETAGTGIVFSHFVSFPVIRGTCTRRCKYVQHM